MRPEHFQSCSASQGHSHSCWTLSCYTPLRTFSRCTHTAWSRMPQATVSSPSVTHRAFAAPEDLLGSSVPHNNPTGAACPPPSATS